jgi:hypothetical protein
MNIEMSGDIEAAIKHSEDGGRVLAKIIDDHGDEAICEVDYDGRFSEWDCVKPAHRLNDITVVEWVSLDTE